MSDSNVVFDELFDDEADDRCCYDCDGSGWKIVCLDDLCHGEDYCIHGDPPVRCRTCNKDGRKDQC